MLITERKVMYAKRLCKNERNLQHIPSERGRSISNIRTVSVINLQSKHHSRIPSSQQSLHYELLKKSQIDTIILVII